MNNSILTSVKKMLGIDECYEAFDPDIIILINSELMTLNQLGIGTKDTFTITSNKEQWTDFVRVNLVPAVREYVYIKVKLIFDPPSSPSVIEVFNKKAEEDLWRMNIVSDNFESSSNNNV